MVKSTRSGKKLEEWTDGGKFLFQGSVEMKGKKANRRRSISPKKSVQNRRKSVMLKRLEINSNTVVSPTTTRRTRRQSMVNLNKGGKKSISRATSEKVLPAHKTITRKIQVLISPILEKKITAKASKTTVNNKISVMNKRESMSKMKIVSPKPKIVAKSKKHEKAASNDLLESIIDCNLVTPRRGRGRNSEVKKSTPKPTSNTVSKTPDSKKSKKSMRPPVSARKKVIVTPTKVTAVNVQLAVANAVSGSAKSKVKRLSQNSPVAGVRLTRSSRKVKLIVESPPKGTAKYRKTPAKADSMNDCSPDFVRKMRNLKPFTPKPDNPYDILKRNMKKRITNRIEMDISPQRLSPSLFMSFASTPSSSCNLPPTPKSSRARQSVDNFIKSERRTLRTYRKDYDTPLSSTPKSVFSSANNSTYMSVNDSCDVKEDLAVVDSPTVNEEKSDDKTKKGYCSIM